jgi:monoamine oxidase
VAQVDRDFDIVIIGAGAAGIGAALESLDKGASYVVLEAMNRVGGRAFTDRSSLPSAWDQGCHWLHCADVNPLVEWADRLGANYQTKGNVDWNGVWLHGEWAEFNVRRDFLDAMDAAFGAVYAAGKRGQDVCIADVLPDAGHWQGLIRHWIQLMSSSDPELVSTAGYADYADTDLNWPVVSGYGDLITRMAEGLSVKLGTPARHVSQDARDVCVTTDAGDIRAGAAIITASTNVLLSGAIQFGKCPARDLLDFINDVPCGNYEKVAIAFDSDPFEDFEQSSLNVLPADGGEPINFQLPKHGKNLAIGHLAGDVAKRFAGQAGDALVDFAMERLVAGFGSDIRKRVVKTATTAWGANPYILGAYSYSKPGCSHRRREMIAADTGNIGFAGEAFSLQWQATAHGAYASGRAVANRLLENLNS